MGFLDDIQKLATSALNVNQARVPLGKQVRIYECPDGENPVVLLPNQTFLGEDLVLNVDSTFSPVMDSSAGLTGGLLQKVTGVNPNVVRALASGTGAEARYKQQSISIWENTSPLSFSITLALYMDYNAEKQVMAPTRELMKTVLPSDRGDGLLLPPGPSATYALSGIIGTVSPELSSNIQGIIKKSTSFTIYKIAIGNYLYLDSILITRAEPIICSEADDEGNPIWSKVRLDIQTTTACTKEMIDAFTDAQFYNINSVKDTYDSSFQRGAVI